ncbi:MAG: hypothetical protein Ta2G_18370 [Termitinemataceae bacterium]|nr:MAG: hypothetical protein Ta2G_18370 [Termitinemataceae bacterium]
MLAVKYPQLRGIAEGLRNFNLVDEIRAVIDAKNKAWRDAEAIKDWQRYEGRREGLEEGRKAGREEAEEIIKAKDAALQAALAEIARLKNS